MLNVVRALRRFLIRRGLIQPRIYVGGSLTHASESFRSQVGWLKNRLRERGWIVLEFLGLENGTARDVYDWDIYKCVGTCDLLVAVCDHPSIGLGVELGIAVEKHGVWVLAVAHRDTYVSRLIEGIPHKRFSFARYRDLEEVVGYVQYRMRL